MVNAWRNISPAKAVGALPPQKTSHQKAIEQENSLKAGDLNPKLIIKIVTKIKAGKAHEISEGDTIYLGACTKGATRDSSYRKQPYSDIPAKQRAFSLKLNYVNLIIKEDIDSEPIVKTISQYGAGQSFEDYVIQQFNPYLNRSVNYLLKKFAPNIDKKPKNYCDIIARGILGIKKRKIAEFEKANISMKTIRIYASGMPKESMSFPAFKYIDLLEEKHWESSELFLTFTKRFFFVIFEHREDDLFLKKVMFWTMPVKDLEIAKSVWIRTRKQIMTGRYGELPKLSDNPISHVRPHGRDKEDTYPTPDGGKFKKQCFWLNARYIKEQIR